MPFKSEKQRRFLWAEHPEIAKRWAKEYPESNQNLPTYAHKNDQKEDSDDKKPEPQKSAEATAQELFQTLFAQNDFNSAIRKVSILDQFAQPIAKTANSKQEKVDLPHSDKPTYAGEEEENGEIPAEIPLDKNIDETSGKNTINTLLQKLSAVLSPSIQQTMENMNAENEGRIARRLGNNIGLKRYAVATPQIPLPMGMQAPAAPQPAQQARQTTPASPTPVGAGQSSATTDPIKFHSGLSASGIINGNAALSAPNTVNTKISRAGDEIQGILMGMDHVDPDDTLDLLAEERMKSAVEKWSAIGLWDRIRAKKKRGEKPAKPGDKDYPDSKSWKKVTAISEKQSGFTTTQMLQAFLPVAAGGTGGALLGSYGPLLAGGKPNLATSLGGTAAGSGLGMLYSYNALTGKHKKNKEEEEDETEKQSGTPAWQKSDGKNEEGGLNAEGRASYNRETGGHLKAPVTEKHPTGKAKKRRHSFCSRMCGMKKHETGSKTKSDPDSRINKALRKWNCKCSSATQFGVKAAQDFDPALSRDAENAVMHGTGLIGSGVLGTVAGIPVSAGLEHLVRQNNLMPDANKNPWQHVFAQGLIRTPIIAGGMLGTRLYDNYILRPHMRRELERKKQEDEIRQQLEMKKHAEASLGRILGTALASTGGGLLLGGYPGWKLQRASEAAGNSDFTNFIAGKAPIALAGALSAGLYNHVYDQYEKKHPEKKPHKPANPSLKYLQYLVH